MNKTISIFHRLPQHATLGMWPEHDTDGDRGNTTLVVRGPWQWPPCSLSRLSQVKGHAVMSVVTPVSHNPLLSWPSSLSRHATPPRPKLIRKYYTLLPTWTGLFYLYWFAHSYMSRDELLTDEDWTRGTVSPSVPRRRNSMVLRRIISIFIPKVSHYTKDFILLFLFITRHHK